MISNLNLGLGTGIVDTIVGLAQGEGLGEAVAGGAGAGLGGFTISSLARPQYRAMRDKRLNSPNDKSVAYYLTDAPNADGSYSLPDAMKRTLYPTLLTGAGMVGGGIPADAIYNQLTGDESNNTILSSSSPSSSDIYNQQLSAMEQQAEMQNRIELEKARALAEIEMEKRAQIQEARERELAMQIEAQNRQLQAEQDMLMVQSAFANFQ